MQGLDDIQTSGRRNFIIRTSLAREEVQRVAYRATLSAHTQGPRELSTSQHIPITYGLRMVTTINVRAIDASSIIRARLEPSMSRARAHVYLDHLSVRTRTMSAVRKTNVMC